MWSSDISEVLTLSNNWEDVSFVLPSMEPHVAIPNKVPNANNEPEMLKNDAMLASSSKDSRIASPRMSMPKRRKGYKMRIQPALESSFVADENDENSDHSGDDFAAKESVEMMRARFVLHNKGLPQKRKRYQESRNRYKKQLKMTKTVCNNFIKSIKSLIPGMDGNIEKAGALEMAVKYVQSLQEAFGSDCKDEFFEAINTR